MNDIAAWKVHGPVRTVRKEHAEWDQDNGEFKTPRGLTAATFRPDGQLSESEYHNPDGSVARSVRLYDDSGRVLEAQSWIDDGPKIRVRYSYDEAGRRSGATEVAADGTIVEIETYRYNDAGRKTKIEALRAARMGVDMMHGVEGSEQWYAAPGATASTTVYDDRDLPVEVTLHDPDNLLVLRIDMSRDADGRLLCEVARSGGDAPFPGLSADKLPGDERAQQMALLSAAFADRPFCAVAFAYDEKGRLIGRTRKIGSLSEERTTFAYDDRDDPIAEVSEEYRREVHLDDDGVVQHRENDPLVQHRRFEYRYDAHGNWTERVAWYRHSAQPDFQRTHVERRTITYYE